MLLSLRKTKDAEQTQRRAPRLLQRIADGPTRPGKREEELNFTVRCRECTAIPVSTDLEVQSSSEDPEKKKKKNTLPG